MFGLCFAFNFEWFVTVLRTLSFREQRGVLKLLTETNGSRFFHWVEMTRFARHLN